VDPCLLSPRLGRREPASVPGGVVAAVLLFSIVIIQFPVAFGDEPPLIVRVASLVPLVAALAVLLLWRGAWRIRPLHAVLFGVYLLLVTVAIVRAGQAEAEALYSPALALFRALEWLLVAGLGLAAFVREPRERARRRHREALCWAPVVYVALNVALHFAGFAAERSGSGYLPTTLLGQLGISGNRTLFPLSLGINSFGAIAGIALASATLLAWRKGARLRWAAVLGAAVSLYAILAVDSRGAFFFSLTAITLVILVPRARARGVAGLAMLLPLLPLFVVGVLATADSRYGEILSRGGTSAATGSSRSVVWEAVLSFLASFRLEHLFGYGSYGQVTSGVSLSYSSVFRGFDDPLLASPHNLLLQSILDTGYVGLLVVLSLCIVLISQLAAQRARDSSPQSSALFAAAVFLILLGVVEAVPVEGAAESFTFWLLALTAALRAPPPARAPARSPPVRAAPGRPIPAAGMAPHQHQSTGIGART